MKTMNTKETNLNRRNFLATSGGAATAAVMAAAGVVAAKEHGKDHGKAAPATKAAAAATAAGTDALSQLASLAADCAVKADLCAAHCTKLLAGGDKEMAACLKTSLECTAACASVARLAALGAGAPATASLKKLAAACADYCRACAKECEKHKDHHAECGACYDACVACGKACDAI